MQATVTSAIALGETRRQKLLKALTIKYGPVDLIEKIDPEIIGGLKVSIESMQIDATTSHRLEQLAEQLLKTN